MLYEVITIVVVGIGPVALHLGKLWIVLGANALVAEIPATMKKVSEFSFDHGILGEGAPNAEFIGMEFPGGKIFGDPVITSYSIHYTKLYDPR